MLTDIQLVALRSGLKDGFMINPRGLVELKMARPRCLEDDVRGRRIPTGDYVLTGWGRLVAANYEASVERLPVGTRLNHRIHSYTPKTVRLADDSDCVSTVDPKRPIKASGCGEGSWLIPITGKTHTIASAKEAWYVRNLLNMDIELKLDEYGSPDDFGGRW